jgi:hypothetical protein
MCNDLGGLALVSAAAGPTPTTSKLTLQAKAYDRIILPTSQIRDERPGTLPEWLTFIVNRRALELSSMVFVPSMRVAAGCRVSYSIFCDQRISQRIFGTRDRQCESQRGARAGRTQLRPGATPRVWAWPLRWLAPTSSRTSTGLTRPQGPVRRDQLLSAIAASAAPRARSHRAAQSSSSVAAGHVDVSGRMLEPPISANRSQGIWDHVISTPEVAVG